MAQQPRVLQPARSPVHLFGARLRSLRQERGLSQAALGRLVFCSGHLICKIEKGERRPQLDFAARCDGALGSHGMLIALALMADRDDSNASPQPTGILDCLPHLRRSLDAHDAPDDGPVRSLAELRGDVGRLVAWRLNSAYADLALRLPALLPELHRAFQMDRNPQVAGLLTQAYRSADAIADKFGLFDLSARIIDLMRNVAFHSGDPLTVASTEYVRAETFFASGDWAAGRRILSQAASNVDHHGQAEARATYGTLHMRAAVLSARSGDPAAAAVHIEEAGRAAQDLPEAIYRGTAFGPASVRIHRLSLALDSDDVDAASAAADGWMPPASVPAERRSHFFVDRARAETLMLKDDAAIESLCVARQVAPQHTRYHADVRATLSILLARTRRPAPTLVGMARWTGVLPEISSRDAEAPATHPANLGSTSPWPTPPGRRPTGNPTDPA